MCPPPNAPIAHRVWKKWHHRDTEAGYTLVRAPALWAVALRRRHSPRARAFGVIGATRREVLPDVSWPEWSDCGPAASQRRAATLCVSAVKQHACRLPEKAQRSHERGHKAET